LPTSCTSVQSRSGAHWRPYPQHGAAPPCQPLRPWAASCGRGLRSGRSASVTPRAGCPMTSRLSALDGRQTPSPALCGTLQAVRGEQGCSWRLLPHAPRLLGGLPAFRPAHVPQRGLSRRQVVLKTGWRPTPSSWHSSTAPRGCIVQRSRAPYEGRWRAFEWRRPGEEPYTRDHQAPRSGAAQILDTEHSRIANEADTDRAFKALHASDRKYCWRVREVLTGGAGRGCGLRREFRGRRLRKRGQPKLDRP
jgi:hypothetical protein